MQAACWLASLSARSAQLAPTAPSDSYAFSHVLRLPCRCGFLRLNCSSFHATVGVGLADFGESRIFAGTSPFFCNSVRSFYNTLCCHHPTAQVVLAGTAEAATTFSACFFVVAVSSCSIRDRSLSVATGGACGLWRVARVWRHEPGQRGDDAQPRHRVHQEPRDAVGGQRSQDGARHLRPPQARGRRCASKRERRRLTGECTRHHVERQGTA